MIDIFYQNVRGLRTKSTILLNSLTTQDSDIFLLTETWLTADHPNAAYFPPTFNVERNDRAHPDMSRGGGVCAALRTGIPYRRRRDLEGDWNVCG